MTRDSLMVSGGDFAGYYIFQLLECGRTIACAITLTDRSGGVVRKSQSRFAIAKWIATKKPFLTYEYWKYVIDPMCRYQ